MQIHDYASNPKPIYQPYVNRYIELPNTDMQGLHFWQFLIKSGN